MKLFTLIFCILSSILLASCASKNEPVSAIKAPLKSEQKPQVKTIYSDLSSLIRNNYNQPERVKLQRVNDFFNERIHWLSDQEIWNEEDYWATPREILKKKAGDCEDFCIAKYYTLVSMGVATEKLKMTYVKDIELNQAHMVLTYYLFKGSEPLVLDNKNKNILKSSLRTDLIPVYSFNHHGTWIAEKNKLGQRVGSSQRNRLWADVSMRIARKYE